MGSAGLPGGPPRALQACGRPVAGEMGGPAVSVDHARASGCVLGGQRPQGLRRGCRELGAWPGSSVSWCLHGCLGANCCHWCVACPVRSL